MTEHIRYSWGTSSLGDFIAAMSDRGLVAFEFGEARTALADSLRSRFPNPVICEDRASLSATVQKLATLVDHPERDAELTLDMRGTEYEKRVWGRLKEIPAGWTKAYGTIAAEMGTPRDARDVTAAIAARSARGRVSSQADSPTLSQRAALARSAA